MAGAPTRPLGTGGGGLLGNVTAAADQVYRTYVGAVGDTVDAARKTVNSPIDAALRAAGSNFQFERGQNLGEMVPKPVGVVSQFTRDALPYVVGPAAGLRAAGAVSNTFRAATAAKPIVAGALAGAGADLALSQVHDANLSNLIEDAGGPRLPTARVEGESAGVAALKDMAEGGVIGTTVEGLIQLFRRPPRPDGQPATADEAAEEAAVEEALLDPVVREQLAASGIDETNPRFQEFAARAQARQAEEAARAADPAANAVPPSFRPAPMAPAEGGGRPSPAIRAARQASAEVDQTIDYRQQLRDDAAAMEARTRLDPADPEYVDPAALPAAGRAAPEPEAPLRATPDGAFRPTEPNLRGQDEMAARGDAQRADTERTFALAERQRARAGGDVRDTQAAGRPEGVAPQRVLLDDQFPVQVIRQEPDGRVTVRRYDPRTGAPEPGAVEYVTSRATLREANYAANPRQAQDFAARADGPAPPEMPRAAGPGAPMREPAQTYRVTPQDPNTDFPGGGGAPDGPTGRSPLPEQPDGPMPGPNQPRGERAQRFRNEEEARARYEQARQEQDYQDFSARARESYKGQDYKTSNSAGPRDAEGRFGVDEFGFVQSDAGGPIRFGDQKQTGKWILNVGQKQSPDQVFEIANHPRGGFTARETGRSSPQGGPEGPGGAGPRPDAPADQPRPQTETGPRGQTGGPVGSTEEVAPGGYMAPSRASDGADAGRQTNQSPDGIPQSPGRQPSSPDAPRAGTPPPTGRGGPRLMSGIDPSEPIEGAIRAIGRVAKATIDSTKIEVAQLLRDLPADLKGSASRIAIAAADATTRVFKQVLFANADVAHAVAARLGNTPAGRAAQEIADAIGTKPGKGRAVGESFERAVEGRALSKLGALSNLLGREVDEALENRVYKILSGQIRPVTGSREAVLARRIRAWLDEHQAFLAKAGVDIGYTKDYFPRTVDGEKVLANAKSREAFRAAATKAYRRAGLSTKEADEAAEAWLERIAGVVDNNFAPGLPASNATKGRALPKGVEVDLAEFLNTDIRAAMGDYIFQTTRAAEFARAFGKNGQKATDAFNLMAKEGVDQAEIDLLRNAYESATGQWFGTGRTPLQSLGNLIQMAGTMALLPKAALSSLAEVVTIVVRSHAPVRTSLELMGQGFADLKRLGEKMPKADYEREVAEAIGILGDAANDLMLSSRLGGDTYKAAGRKVMSKFFRANLLHQITEYQRLTSSRIGQRMMRRWLNDLDNPRVAASTKRILANLGVDEKAAADIKAWVAKSDGAVPTHDLWGDHPGAKAYRVAVKRFVDESIQSVTAGDRPAYANTPVGRISYGLMSFIYSFQRNVLTATVNNVKAAADLRANLTLEDRARLASPALGLGLLVVAQSVVSHFRNETLSPTRYAERTETDRTLENLSRAGAFGIADPIVNYFLSLKYERDLTSMLTGAYPTFFLGAAAKQLGLVPKELNLFGATIELGANTENTTNAENAAAKSAYQAIAVPLLSLGISTVPVGGALRIGQAGALIAGSSPEAAQGFADAVAGERTVKPGGSRPKRAESSMSLDDDMDLDDDLGL
jgi:hypothetical protein